MSKDTESPVDLKLSVEALDALPSGSVVAIMWREQVASAWVKRAGQWSCTSPGPRFPQDANGLRYYAIGGAGEPDCEIRVLHEGPGA